ncbi:MAG: DUF2993 domain-containing protein [Burkholderiaceae bacterium]|nr:DUF2993 domain-containing protein [Microbacteriaceae bacterium]
MADSTPASVGEPASIAPRRRRRRVIIAVSVVAVLVAALAIAADVAARAITTTAVTSQLRSALALPADSAVDVRVGGFSMLAQLAQGRLDQVDITAPGVTFGELSGDAVVTGLGIPLDRSQTVDSVSIDFRVDQSQLTALSANLSGLPVSDVELSDSDIRIVAEFTAFGVTVPIGVGLLPGADSGALTFSPQSITVAGATISADELRQLFGAPGVLALRTQSICIAQYLPASLELSAVSVDAPDLVLSLRGSVVPIDEAALALKGDCSL